MKIIRYSPATGRAVIGKADRAEHFCMRIFEQEFPDYDRKKI